MSTQHTPDRLIQSVNIIRDANGLVAISDNPEAASRLAACLNACDGVSTENLENNLPVKELATRYNAVLAQRDDLLAEVVELNRQRDKMLEALRIAEKFVKQLEDDDDYTEGQQETIISIRDAINEVGGAA